MVVSTQREKVRSGRKGDKRFEGEGGAGVLHWQRARLNSGGIQAGGVTGGSHTVGRCGISRRSRDAAGGSSRSESCQEF